MAKKSKATSDTKLKKKKPTRASGDVADSKSSKAADRAERKKHKGKKFTVDDDAIKVMRKNLADIGCKLDEVEPDGNCLFRSLGDQLFGDQQQHEEIRKRIVDYIESKRTDFEPFMEDEEKFDHYCARMREHGTWGGNQELYAAARLFSVYIVVHQETSRVVIECDAEKPKNVIHIAYHGSDHYDSIRSLRDADLNAPPIAIELDVDGFRSQDLVKRWQSQAANAPVASLHRIATNNADPIQSLTTEIDELHVQSTTTTTTTTSPSTPVVLSKKAQRLLKKHQRASTTTTRTKKSSHVQELDQSPPPLHTGCKI